MATLRFSVEMDETLRAAMQSRFASMRPQRRWPAISKLIANTTPEQCQARWEHIKGLPGLEYKAIAFTSGHDRQRSRDRADSSEDITRSRSTSADASDTREQPISHEAEPAEGSPKREVIVLHVLDEHRKINRDFVCQKELLLREMKYFRNYLTDGTNSEDIDISVHCDVKIFEWLVRYLHQPDQTPVLEPATVVSILISSDFLQMERLVKQCLYYMKLHLSEIIKMPIDLNCIRDDLVRQLSDTFTDVELDAVKDKKEKLAGKLYLRKIEDMFADKENGLHRCAFCGKLFTASQREWMICTKAKVFIDFHGTVIAQHVIDRTWDLHHSLSTLKAKKLSWRDIYWKLWGLQQSFECSVCGSKFPAAELGHCSYHPSEPHFSEGDNVGTYPCCNRQALRFDTSIRKMGCCARAHQPRLADVHARAAHEILVKRQQVVLVPFGGPADDIGVVAGDSIMPQQHSQVRDMDEDDDVDDAGSAGSSYGTDTDARSSDAYSDSDSDEYHGQGQPKWKKTPQTKAKARAVSKLSPRRKRLWQSDVIREEDIARTESIMKSLELLRVDGATKKELREEFAGGTASRIFSRIRAQLAKTAPRVPASTRSRPQIKT